MHGFKTSLDDSVREPSIIEMVPPNGLFRSYVARAQGLTDSPSVYLLTACLSTFSAIVSPRARIVYRDGLLVRRERIHLWSLLLGPSYNRKSHALDMAAGYEDFRGVFEDYVKDRRCPDSGTRRGFENFMIEHQDAFLAIRDAPIWISDNHSTLMKNGAAWWCKVFDGRLEPRLRDKMDETEIQTSYPVCICLCAAGETTAVLGAARPTDWTGGMFSRMLLVSAGRLKERDTFFDWPERDLVHLRGTMDAVIKLCKKSPDVVISPAAWSIYKTWNAPIRESAERLSAAKSAILGRLGRHVKVISALYALGNLKNEVGAEHMKAAVALGSKSHKSVMELPI